MKNLLSLVFFVISSQSFAQSHTTMPAEAYTFYKEAMGAIKPRLKSFIEKSACNLRDKRVKTDSLVQVLRKEPLLENASQRELEAIVVLIMVQVSKNADADLKDLVLAMPKSELPSGQEADGGKNESENRMENIMAAKSLIARDVSLVMKRIAGSQEMVIDNLR